MKKLILFLIRIYQRFFSPDQGIISFLFPLRFCRFFPSCSQYTYLSIQKYGLKTGIIKGLKRILRCHPWHPGGIDLP